MFDFKFVNLKKTPRIFLVFDETKEIHCSQIFPNTLSLVHARLNSTLVHLEGAYIALLDPVDKYIQSVVSAQAKACLSIMKMIKDFEGNA